MAFFEYRPNSTLFYYAGIGGFRGIIQSKKLWLSDVTASNDPRELALGRQLLAEAIGSYRNGQVPGVTTQDLAGFLDDLAWFQRNSTCYTCCFALDGDALPMWREYAEGGTGVSIGFRPTAISSIPGRMQLVQYAEDDAPEFFRAVAMLAAATMGRPRTLQRVLALSEAFAAITSLKHRSWKYEREARIIYNQRHMKPDPQWIITKYTSEHPDGRLVEWREPLVRQSRGRNVTYLDFPFGKYSNGEAHPQRAIECVYRGPRCELSIAEIEALLMEEGFQGVRVIQSDCAVQ